MSVEGWARWCRSRRARVWTINILVLTFVCAWLDRSGSDVEIVSEVGSQLPSPLRTAHAGLFHVLAVVTPPLMGLTLVLLVGVSWSRAIRPARWVFLPTLLALLAAMTELSQVFIYLSWAAHMPDPPAWIVEFSMDMLPWRRLAILGGLCLVAVGGAALLIRAFRVHVLRTAEPLSGQTE